MDMSQAAAVYAEQLLPLGHGFPQWFPDHATGQAEVRIGDIGYFRDGLFHRVCNATLPTDHLANECGVPEGFDPLTYDSANLLRTNDAYLPDGSLASRTMKHVNKSSGMDLSIPDIQPGPQSALAYECFSNKGGLLVLKGGGATQDIVLPNTTFPEYMLAHYDSWYKLARERGHSIGPEDLIMVNGTVKASDWTVSSYSDKGKHHSFNFDLPGPIHAMAGFSSTKRDMSEQKRSRLGNVAKSGEETGMLAKDQCVFVSRYVIRHRYQSRSTRLGGTSSLRAGKKTSQANGVSSSGKPDNYVKRTTRKGVSRSQIWDPVEVLLGYILKNSECDAAIASDDDIKRLLEAGYQIEPDHFKKRLYAAKPRIQVSDKGLGKITHNDNEAHHAGTSADGHEQPRKKSRFSSMFPLTSYVRKAISDEDARNLRSSISAVVRAVMGGLERATRPKPTHWDYQSPLEMDNSLWEELVGPAHTRTVQQVLDDARADAPPLSFT